MFTMFSIPKSTNDLITFLDGFFLFHFKQNTFKHATTIGQLVPLKIPEGTKVAQIRKLIEKSCGIIDSFKPVIKIPICANCGFKGEKLAEKCPICKSSYII